MAGYMTKLQGRVYDGAHMAAEKLQNGIFAEITADGVKAVTGAKDTVMRVAEKGELWGLPAVVLDVVSVGADEVFCVENEFDFAADADYDATTYEIAKGEFVRMHRPLPGEQQIVSVTEELYAVLNVADKVKPAAAGTIATV